MTGVTFADELESAAQILRSQSSPISDSELAGAVADMLSEEEVASRYRQVGSAALRTARAVVALREARSG